MEGARTDDEDEDDTTREEPAMEEAEATEEVLDVPMHAPERAATPPAPHLWEDSLWSITEYCAGCARNAHIL